MSKPITFVTGNANKLLEVQQILGPASTLTNQKLDIEEVQGTVAEVTIAKTLKAATMIDGPVLVEDTALEFNGLNGMPGPYIKWFLESLGNDGLYKLLAGFEDKSSRAICTFGFCEGPGHEVKLFQGFCEGSIVAPRYSKDPNRKVFGWNPVFEPKGWTTTFAEMTEEEKNSISHRFLALMKLKEFLEKRAQN